MGMDARVIKTKKVIKESFLELRKSKPLEKIKVKDLCELAIINKSTFYKYYWDVFDLSEKLENECLAKMEVTGRNMDSLFTEPMDFLRGVPDFADNEELKILFNGRENVLVEKIKTRLYSIYEAEKRTDEERIKLYFIVNGGFDTLFQLMRFGIKKEKIEAEIGDLIARIVDN